MQLGHHAAEAVAQHAPHGRGREVEDEGVQAGVEGAGEQRHVPPRLALQPHEAHQVRGVVRAEADGEHHQRAQRQADGPQPPPPADVGQARQDEHEVDVTEAADGKGHAEEDEEELQAQRHQDVQLVLGEVQVAGGRRRGAGAVAVPLHVGDDVDEAEVQHGHQPEGGAGGGGVARPAPQGVAQRVGHAQVALHADGGEQQRAVVDGDVEDEAREGAERVGQQPGHVVGRLLHLEGQEGEEDQVGHGQIEEEHVDGRRLAPHLAAEGAEGHDVGGDAHQEGEDVADEQQAAAQHGGGRVPPPRVAAAGEKTAENVSGSNLKGWTSRLLLKSTATAIVQIFYSTWYHFISIHLSFIHLSVICHPSSITIYPSIHYHFVVPLQLFLYRLSVRAICGVQ